MERAPSASAVGRKNQASPVGCTMASYPTQASSSTGSRSLQKFRRRLSYPCHFYTINYCSPEARRSLVPFETTNITDEKRLRIHKVFMRLTIVLLHRIAYQGYSIKFCREYPRLDSMASSPQIEKGSKLNLPGSRLLAVSSYAWLLGVPIGR